MVKQRRPGSQLTRSRKAGRPPADQPRRPVPGSAITPPDGKHSHSAEALALYERGVAALQAHDYSRATSFLTSVLTSYPNERELHERVRLYLNVCERHMAPLAGAPNTPEERLFAATLALNAGNAGEALQYLLRVSTEAPDNDYALYMLATALAQHNRADEAVPHLIRAMELNPENRLLAKKDPDLEPLRHREEIRLALETPHNRSDNRKQPRRSR
jgi:tetratricopeptide (TPR) repeat protein